MLLWFSCVGAFAQGQGNLWYFGDNIGLDFGGGSPSLVSGGQTGTDAPGVGSQEGTASVCDRYGNLLFYTSGKTIWNRNHQPMPNGTNLFGGTSSTQSSIIVPLPGSDSIFYVFTADDFLAYLFVTNQKGYRYSVVDMCLDSTYGDVVQGQKNILLADSSTEKISACLDASRTGYWIVGHKMFSRDFYAWHLTEYGITDTVVSRIGSFHGEGMSEALAQGQMKFSADGSKLALAISNTAPGIVDIFDFNRSDGTVSNQCHFELDAGSRIFGIEFSPDGSKLYVPTRADFSTKNLYQLDLTSGDCSTIINSRFLLYTATGNVGYGMQLAPNGKIYWVGNTHYDLSCINNPNLLGTAADFQVSAISFSGYNYLTLPSFIAGYQYLHNSPRCLNCIDMPIAKFNYFPNLGELSFADQSGGLVPDNWHWDFGDGTTSILQNPVHTYDTSGTYVVTFTSCVGSCCDVTKDTIRVGTVGLDELSNLDKPILYQNIPNPFGEETTINYYLPQTVRDAKVVFHDNLGRQIVENELKTKGNSGINISGGKLMAGIYTYSLVVDGELITTKKLVKR